MLDTVRFHSFRSLIIAFGGNEQSPNDTDLDGSIGDFLGDDQNREGIFDVAQYMYDTGWDVLAFNEEELTAPEDVPFTEAVKALEKRFVDELGIMGFSHGGGATHDLIERLWDEEDIITRIGVYVDAVQHFDTDPEARFPIATPYLLSFYEDIYELPVNFGGADIPDNERLPGAGLEEYPVTTDTNFPASLDHYSIDDDPLVQFIIMDALEDLLVNR